MAIVDVKNYMCLRDVLRLLTFPTSPKHDGSMIAYSSALPKAEFRTSSALTRTGFPFSSATTTLSPNFAFRS